MCGHISVKLGQAHVTLMTFSWSWAQRSRTQTFTELFQYRQNSRQFAIKDYLVIVTPPALITA